MAALSIFLFYFCIHFFYVNVSAHRQLHALKKLYWARAVANLGGCIGCIFKSFPTRSSLSKSAQGFQCDSKHGNTTVIHQLCLIFTKIFLGEVPQTPTSERGKPAPIPSSSHFASCLNQSNCAPPPPSSTQMDPPLSEHTRTIFLVRQSYT